MRTRKTTINFRSPFCLNRDVGVLPAGPYHVEIDEEEIEIAGRTGYRRIAAYVFVDSPGSSRMLTLDPALLDAALERDALAAEKG